MRVAIVDGLVTLFYDGSKEPYNRKLHDEWWKEFCSSGLDSRSWEEQWEEWTHLSSECREYWKERQSWQQIIIVEGVTDIPDCTFSRCYNVRRVIFADTVIEIGWRAFSFCKNLSFVKLPTRVEYIGSVAFHACNLSSIFIPPRCREVKSAAFSKNRKFEILNLSRNTTLENKVISSTKLLEGSQYKNATDWTDSYYHSLGSINSWLKNINIDEGLVLHKVCSSFEPTLEMILDAMRNEGGLMAFKVENSIGITPSRYLKENPYAHVSEKEVIEKYVLQMMGEE